MTDRGPETPGEGGGGDHTPPAAPLSIGRQYVKDLSFENPNAPDIFRDAMEAPSITMKVDLDSTKLDETTHEVVIGLQIEAKKNDRAAFIIDLQYGAMVTLRGDLSDGAVNHLLKAETPRHLFPFIRAIVANLTRDGSYPPLLLNPIDFTQVFLARRKQVLKDRAEKEGAGAQT